jgi:hypothetical protein
MFTLLDPGLDHRLPGILVEAFLLFLRGRCAQFRRIDPPILTGLVSGDSLRPELVFVTPKIFNSYRAASYRPKTPATSFIL